MPANTIMTDQYFGVIIDNDRDRRTFAWLRTQRTTAEIMDAVDNIAGNRRPYLTNVLRILDLTAPEDLSITPRSEAKSRVAALKRALSGQS